MGGTRDYNFINGPETPTLPTATTPSASADIVNKGYADSTYAPSTNIPNSSLATMANQTVKGNVSGGSAVPSDLSVAQVKTLLSLTGTNSGDVTLAAVGAVPNANGASLSTQALTLQPADGSNPGVVTAGAQTIAGRRPSPRHPSSRRLPRPFRYSLMPQRTSFQP
jgi:hypothetical protein